jgi:hypothetical protein
MLCGSLSPLHGVALGHRCRKWPSDMEHNWKYIEHSYLSWPTLFGCALSFGTNWFRNNVMFLHKFSEASTSTTEPSPLIMCSVIYCCLNHWNQALEHWNFIFIFNVSSFAFSLTVGPPPTGMLIAQAWQKYSNNLPINCHTQFHGFPFSLVFLLLLDLTFPWNPNFSEMSTMLRIP